MTDGHTSRQHSGFASHADDVASQPWVEQGAAASPSTDDGRPTAAALPTDAAGDDPTLTDTQAGSTCTKSPPDMAAAAHDHRAVASHAAPALVHSPEEGPSASSNWPQSGAVGSGSSAHGTSLEPSCASYPCEPSVGDSPPDASSGQTTVPTTTATAVEPAPGDMGIPTGRTLVVPDEPQLVCTDLPHSVAELEVAVLGELAVGGLVCPAAAVAAHKSKARPAEVATQTYGQVRVQYSEDAGGERPAEPVIAPRADAQADIDSLAARADATEDAAFSPLPESNVALDADCTLHQCSSAVAAMGKREAAVAVAESATLLPPQEDRPGVLSINAKSVVDHTQASASDAARACVIEEAITEPGLLDSPTGAVAQPDIDSSVAQAAEPQPVLQRDSQDNMQHPNSDRDPCMHPQISAYTGFNTNSQVAPDIGPVADLQATPCADCFDKSILDAGPDGLLAADAGAVPAVPSQPYTPVSLSDQPSDTADVMQIDHICDTLLVTALTVTAKAEATAAAAAAASAESDATAVLPDYSPQVAVLEGNEDSNADLAAELAAMMTLADSLSALPAQDLHEFTQSNHFQRCHDGAAAFDCTEDPGPVVVEVTETPITLTATVSQEELSIPASNVGPGAAIMRSPALSEPEQRVAIPKERDKASFHSERLLAAAAATSQEAWVAVHVECAVDAATWHAHLVDISWRRTTQLQSMLANAGTAFFIKCPES